MRKNEKGTIIVFVVVIIGIISLLYASTYVLMGIENRISISVEDRLKAYYVAESGIERALGEIKRFNTPASIIESGPNPFSYNGKHSYVAEITSNNPNYSIKSTGIYRNTKRIISVTLIKNNGDLQIQSWKEVNN